MAADQERAERIRDIKARNPGLTWARIADEVGVTERSVLGWAQTGGISYDNARKLATLVDVDPDWLWAGERETPALMEKLSASPNPQLDRIEALLTDMQQRLEFVEQALVESLSREAQSAARAAATAAEAMPATDRDAGAPGRKKRSPATRGR